MTRIARPQCAQCIYWIPDNPETTGHCHRYPPSVYYNSHGHVAAQKVPTVDHRNWCGEWSSDDSRLGDLAKQSMHRAAKAD